MATFRQIILTPSDSACIRLMELLKKDFEGEIKLSVDGLSGPQADDSELYRRASSSIGHLLSTATWHREGISVKVYIANIFKDRAWQDHPYLSVLETNTTDQDERKLDDSFLLEIKYKIDEFLRSSSLYAPAAPDDESPSQSALIMSALQTAAADQIAATNRFFQQLTIEFDQRRAKLQDEIDSQRRELETDFLGKASKLESDREAFEKIRTTLDDRNNTHARRAVVQYLLERLQKRQEGFSLPKETTGLRSPIHILFILILLFMAAGVAVTLYQWNSSVSDIWSAQTITTGAKTVVFTFGLITFSGFYLSWMNRWFDKHAGAQFQSRQFEIDINRASWAVEAALEWKVAQGEQMPEALLAGITKGLFDSNASGELKDFSPLDALASSILGSASKVDVKTPGAELSFDRKGLKNLQKSGD